MKRLSVLLLVLLLIPGLIAVPASAATEQDIVDIIRTSHNNLVAFLGQTLEAIYNAIWDAHDELGEWLGTGFGDLRDLLTDAVDYLGWIDQEVSSIETNVLKILQEIYTQGTLTIGECVKGIRSYIVNIADNLTPSMGGKLADIIDSTYNYVSQIGMYVEMLANGNFDKVEDVLDDSPPLQTEMDEFEEILATAPTVDEDAFDTALGDVNGKFNGITTDENGAVLFGAFGQLANTQPLSVMIPTSAMLAVLSFALFGRTF